MDLSALTMRDIGYVLALAKYRHFGHAAEASAVSQPALSKQIAHLEKQLGVTLFERNKRTVRITSTGQQFIDQAHLLWQNGIMLMDVAQESQSLAQLPWRMGVIASVCPYVLPILLPHLLQTIPLLVIQEGMTQELIAALNAGTLDVVWAAATVEEPSLTAHRFYWEPFYMATSQPDRYYNPIPKGFKLDANQLILLKDGHCLSDQTLGLCGVLPTQKAVRAQQLDTLILMAANNLGDAVIPALAKKQLAQSGLTYIPFADEGRDIVLYTRQTSHNASRLANQLIADWADILKHACLAI